LVIEIKRPTVKAGDAEVTQLEKVAMNVQNSEAFSKDPNKVHWMFVLVVNDLGDYGRWRISKSPFQQGCLSKDDSSEFWLLEWNDVIHNARTRYEFFRDKLNLEASGERGLEYLKKNYSHLLTGRGMRKGKEISSGKLVPKTSRTRRHSDQPSGVPTPHTTAKPANVHSEKVNGDE
jgi:hypothetical protein